MRQHDPLHDRQACPEFIAFDQRLVQYVPGRSYFRAVLCQNGDKYVTSPPPSIVELVFGTIKASYLHCRGLLPEVSPVFDRTETILGEIFSTFASLPELSLEARPPVSSLSGSVPSRHLFGVVSKLPPEVSLVFISKAVVGTVSTSCATPYELSSGLVITKLSLRPIVDCRGFSTRWTCMPAG